MTTPAPDTAARPRHGRAFDLLLAVVLVHVAILSTELPAPWQDVSNLVAAPLLAYLLFRLTGRARDFRVVLVAAALGPVLNFLVPWQTAPVAVDLLKVALWSLAPAYLVARLIGLLAASDDIRRHEIAGAVTVYLLLGLVYANIFQALLLLHPQALRFGDNFGGRAVNFGDILYFSYVTLATVGYGDVAPARPIARMVAVMEAITGLMFVSILISRFVALHTQRRPSA